MTCAATAALSTGYLTAKLTNDLPDKMVRIQGFIPADERILRELTRFFAKEVNSSETPGIIADPKQASIIAEEYKCKVNATDGKVKIILTRLSGSMLSDIVIMKSDNLIMSPVSFSPEFSNLRSQLYDRKAEYFFNAEYRQSSLLKSLFKGSDKIAVIQTGNGSFDRLNLSKQLDDIMIPGTIGKTILTLRDGTIFVRSSCCRNKICRHSGFISEPGQMIVCAPNKISVNIETV